MICVMFYADVEPQNHPIMYAASMFYFMTHLHDINVYHFGILNNILWYLDVVPTDLGLVWPWLVLHYSCDPLQMTY